MQANRAKIKVGISCGDPAGIGLEVILKVFADARMFDVCTPILYCPERTFRQYRKDINMDNVAHARIKSEAEANSKRLHLMECHGAHTDVVLGNGNNGTGEIAFASLKMATEAIATNKIDVLVTAPIDKKLIQSEAFPFKGHTEYLANYANVDDFVMFMVYENLRVGIVTGHMALQDVAKKLSEQAILKKLQVIQKSLIHDFSIDKPKIAVLSLNPHAGDNGLMGDEEEKVIVPAIKKAIQQGMMVFGPYAADGFFANGAFKKYDAVLGMYHDQGLIPFKTISMGEGVNFTAGLPIVRTSPDHGTAFDIAGKGIADEASFRNAIYAAVDIFYERQHNKQLRKNVLKTESHKIV